jgi:hypothetical protein
MRTRLLSVPRRLALAALMAVSALAGARANDANPPAGVAGQGDADGAAAAQPAAALAPLATPPNTNNATRARSDPASRKQATSSRRRTHDTKPSSALVNRSRPTAALPQSARQATSPAPSAPPPPVARGAVPVVTQTQAKDPDPRDTGPHADRASRDRAER